MIVEIAQSVVIIVLAFLVLGLYRQLAMFLEPGAVTLEKAAGPPIGKAVPGVLLDAMDELGLAPTDSTTTVICYVSESCAGCQRLLASLTREETRRRLIEAGKRVLVFAKLPSDSFLTALRETGLPVHIDEDGLAWSVSNVTATPLMVDVGAGGLVVGKAVDHRIDAILGGVQDAAAQRARS